MEMDIGHFYVIRKHEKGKDLQNRLFVIPYLQLMLFLISLLNRCLLEELGYKI